MRQQIQQRFEHNIGRVRNLLTLYRNLAPRGQGRRPVHATDMLRSALVLLHASLEDVLRSVAAWKFPASGEAVLNDVPLVGLGEGGRPEKFHLGKLVPHRAKSVQALIDESVKAAINRMSFNNTTDIASILAYRHRFNSRQGRSRSAGVPVALSTTRSNDRAKASHCSSGGQK